MRKSLYMKLLDIAFQSHDNRADSAFMTHYDAIAYQSTHISSSFRKCFVRMIFIVTIRNGHDARIIQQGTFVSHKKKCSHGHEDKKNSTILANIILMDVYSAHFLRFSSIFQRILFSTQTNFKQKKYKKKNKPKKSSGLWWHFRKYQSSIYDFLKKLSS